MYILEQTTNGSLYKFFYFDLKNKTVRVTLINPQGLLCNTNTSIEVKNTTAIIVTPKTVEHVLTSEDVFCTRKHPSHIGLDVESSGKVHDDGLYHYRIHGILDHHKVLMDWFNPVVFCPGSYDFKLTAKPQDWSWAFPDKAGLHHD